MEFNRLDKFHGPNLIQRWPKPWAASGFVRFSVAETVWVSTEILSRDCCVWSFSLVWKAPTERWNLGQISGKMYLCKKNVTPLGLCTLHIAMITSVGCIWASLDAGVHYLIIILLCLENINRYFFSQGLYLALETHFTTEEGNRSIIILPVVSKLILFHFWFLILKSE